MHRLQQSLVDGLDDGGVTRRALHDLDLLEYLRRQSRRAAEEAVEEPVDREEPLGPPLHTPSRDKKR